MSFREFLRQELDRTGIRPAELARRSGVTPQNISRILTDKPHPITGAAPKVSEDTVESLAKALDSDIDAAREAAGYTPRNNQPLFNIAPDLSIKFGTEVSPEDQKAIAEEVALAYEIIMARRKRRLAQDDE